MLGRRQLGLSNTVRRFAVAKHKPYCNLCNVWELIERLDYKSMEIK